MHLSGLGLPGPKRPQRRFKASLGLGTPQKCWPEAWGWFRVGKGFVWGWFGGGGKLGQGGFQRKPPFLGVPILIFLRYHIGDDWLRAYVFVKPFSGRFAGSPVWRQSRTSRGLLGGLKYVPQTVGTTTNWHTIGCQNVAHSRIDHCICRTHCHTASTHTPICVELYTTPKGGTGLWSTHTHIHKAHTPNSTA